MWIACGVPTYIIKILLYIYLYMIGNRNPKKSRWTWGSATTQLSEQLARVDVPLSTQHDALVDTYNEKKKNHKNHYSPAKLVPWLLICSNTIGYVLPVYTHIIVIYNNIYDMCTCYIRVIIIAPPKQ